MRLRVPRVMMRWHARHGGHIGCHIGHVRVWYRCVHIVYFWPFHFGLWTDGRRRGREHGLVVSVWYTVIQRSRLRIVGLWGGYFRGVLRGRLWRLSRALLVRLWSNGTLTAELSRGRGSRTWALFHDFLVLWPSVLEPNLHLQWEQECLSNEFGISILYTVTKGALSVVSKVVRSQSN